MEEVKHEDHPVVDVKQNRVSVPMIALRGPSIFPQMLLTLDIERRVSVAALNNANRFERTVFIAAQRDPLVDIPEEKDLYRIGVVCRIRQLLQQPGASVCRVMLEGLYRASAEEMYLDPKGYTAVLVPLEDLPERISETRKEALIRTSVSLYQEYLQLSGEFNPDQLLTLFSNSTPSYISDFLAQNVMLTPFEKQHLLEELHPCRRLMDINRYLGHELDIMNIEKELNDAAIESMNRGQREYYLREELKAIQSELGEDGADELDEYQKKIDALPVSDEVKTKLRKELSHLSKQPFGSSEGAVIRTYLDTCLELPWGKYTKETVDIKKARSILDRDHYGLEKVKERILEYLAVKQLSPEIKGGLLCLSGAPGTGKTSIAMSVAKATNRKLVRISLGGVHDEADIRGHRKTYIGSMPGRIINAIVQAGSSNPLVVLDEIDKLGSDYRGDPAAALLEVLDPEQNSSFRDHFLEIPFDLSHVFFITTANNTTTIPRALLDRMEVIELPSYTDEEKLQIAKKHLLPKQRRKHGLSAAQLKVRDDAIRSLIPAYTRESGVRVLERELAAICRKAAGGIAENKFTSLTVKPDNLAELLGPVRFKADEQRKKDTVGLVRGLAWTSVGGEVLDVEVAVVDGNGKLELTGNLGDVMKESAKAAITCIRSRAVQLGIEPEFYNKKDIHIHFPEGAVPKDGPSAGITMTVAIISALTGKPVRHDVAMTGEITLRGRVLAIGGLREKTMAALRNSVSTVILPADNESDLEEIDPLVRSKLSFKPVSSIDEVIPAALAEVP
ncbi:MAG: endopeptidase La [Oscillospiraceae bacterium]|nr:endopeptidase La [Oscillospiraceae bacterium]